MIHIIEGLGGYPNGTVKKTFNKISTPDKLSNYMFHPWTDKGVKHYQDARIIIGHSYGGDTALEITRKLNNVLLITIDLRPQWWRSIDLSALQNGSHWLNFYHKGLIMPGTSCVNANENTAIIGVNHWTVVEAALNVLSVSQVIDF